MAVFRSKNSSCNAKNGLSKFLYSGAIFSTSTSKAFPIALHAKIFIEKRSSFFTFGCRIMRSISNILKSSSDSCLETFLMNLKSALSLKKTFEIMLEIVLSSSFGKRKVKSSSHKDSIDVIHQVLSYFFVFFKKS